MHQHCSSSVLAKIEILYHERRWRKLQIIVVKFILIITTREQGLMVLNLQFIISSIMALDFLISYCIWNGICKLHVFNCETVTTNVNGPTVHFACLQIPFPPFHHWVKCCLCNRCLCPDLFPHYGYGISLTIATNKPQEDPALDT